ncbi:MAG: ATP-binding protein, partial [Planctomycetota bacterium]
MIEKPLDDINASDVRALIEENEAERKTLEYKRQLPGDTPSDKDKLRKTATSLANTAGGDLVFGIAESDEGLTLHGIEDVSED